MKVHRSSLILIEDKLPMLVYCDLSLKDYYEIVIQTSSGKPYGVTVRIAKIEFKAPEFNINYFE